MTRFSRTLLATTTLSMIGLATPANSQATSTTTGAQTGEQAVAADAGDAIVVTGIRQSLRDSIATKRRANSIVDVISAEAVGKFPDRNVAESLSHLPGVTVDHQFGEGEQVSIAGVEPALNRILIDGHSIASADWGGNPSDRSSRSFNYSLMSPEIISQAVVYKTPEARLQEGSIGATVDIVTRKPLDLKPNTLTASGGYTYNDRSKRGNPRASVLYSWHNEDGTFGVLGSVGFDRQYLSRAGVAIYGYLTGASLLDTYPKDATGAIQYNADGTVTGGARINGATATRTSIAQLSAARLPAFLAHEYFEQTRQRLTGSGAVQFKPADNLTLTATGLVIRGKYDNFSNSEYSYNVRGANLQSATITNGLITSATYSGNPATSSTWMGELDTNLRITRIKNDSGTLLFDWRPEGWSITGNGGYSRASGGKKPEYLLSFRTRQGFTVGASGRNTTLNWASPASDATQWVGVYPAEASLQTDPLILAANGGRPFFGAQIGGITNSENTVDKEKFGQVDFARDLNFGPFTKLLFGARYSDHDNSQTTFGGASYTNTAFTLADLGSFVLDSGLYDGLSTSGNATPYATIRRDAVKKTLTGTGVINITRPLDTGSFFAVNEKIATAYVQANFEADRIRGNIGGRFVQTKDNSNYFLSSGSTTLPFTFDKTDNRFLPSFNIAYDVADTVVLRAAAAKVIARPRYSDLAGSLSVDDTQRTGGGGNPDLNPYAATNFGASAEWYPSTGSLISGEVFYRDISNYIGNETFDQELTNLITNRTLIYNISRPVNGGKAKVTGFSITAQASLMWGFGIQTNYTFADATTSIGTGLPFLSRNTVNVIPYYERGPFQARLSYNRRSKYFYRIGRLQSSDYTDAYRQLDFSASYNVNANFSVTANASNLLDETYYQFSSTKDAPTALYKNGRTFSISAAFKM